MKKRKTVSHNDMSIMQMHKTVMRALNDEENTLRGPLKIGTLSRQNFIETYKHTLAELTLQSKVVVIKFKRPYASYIVNGKSSKLQVYKDQYETMCRA